MEVNLSRRQNQLTELETFKKNIDTEVTMILQSLQWDRKYLMETADLVSCHYDSNHRVPPDKLVEHEKVCFLKSQGYSEEDRFLPSPVDPDAATLVKLGSDELDEIINNASRGQTVFNRVLIGTYGCEQLYPFIFKGAGCSGPQPLTLDRLQATYTWEERRAIHDAVVNQMPSCHDLSDLTLLSAKDEGKDSKPKSKLEILAELRDMKRRRTKYRVAPKTRNYSDVLRDVIHTQMELYTQSQENLKPQIKKEEETEDFRTSKDTNSVRCHDKRDMNREYQRVEACSSDSESRHSRYHKDYKSRKRRHDDEYLPNKYSRSNRKSSERDNEKNVKTGKSYASDRRQDKYARRKDDKEKGKRSHKEDYEVEREEKSKQDITVAVKNIKKERNDLTETEDISHGKHATDIQKYYTEKEEANEHDFYDSNNYEKSKNYTKAKETFRDSAEKYNSGNKKHYDEKRSKSNRGDNEKSRERINERESGWSDDSDNSYSDRRHRRSKKKYANSSTEDKHKEKSGHVKHEHTEPHDKRDRYRRTDHRSKRDKRKNDIDGNQKSSHFRHKTGDNRESDSYQRDLYDLESDDKHRKYDKKEKHDREYRSRKGKKRLDE